MNRPKSQDLYTCHECGQSWTITRAGTFNTRPPAFCPSCGTPSLRSAPDAWGGLSADCCKALQVDRQLAQLLFEQWAANRHNEQDKHPRFIDYLREQLA